MIWGQKVKGQGHRVTHKVQKGDRVAGVSYAVYRLPRALESCRGTHQLEFCWQPVPRLRYSDGERPLTEFQTGPGDDIIAVGRISKSRPHRRQTKTSLLQQ